ncbi:MAG: hypothetical protein IRZ08_18190 [Frankia sp.]|nr:hypothetical protein [Frankia sp.]
MARSGEKLTGAQLGAMIALMAEAREVANPELDERYGFTLTGDDRRRLNDLKLVESHRQGRAYVHELTEDGWARMLAELTAPVPPKSTKIPVGAVYALLNGLHRHLVRDRLSLADVFRPDSALADATDTASPVATADAVVADGPAATATDLAPAGTAAGAAPAGPAAGTAPPAATGTDNGAGDIEARIRAAYRRLARRPGAAIRLAERRPRRGDGLDRAAVDEVLRALNRDPRSGVTVAPEEDQKVLTSADLRNAVRIGGQDKHLLMIVS